jgi:hypothetical protein
MNTYNKLVFLNSDKTVTILNEKSGHWHDDCWWSNSDYKTEWKQWSHSNNNTTTYYGTKTNTVNTSDKSMGNIGNTKYKKPYVSHSSTVTENGKKFKRSVMSNGVIKYDAIEAKNELENDLHMLDYDKDSNGSTTLVPCDFCNVNFDPNSLQRIDWDGIFWVCPTCYSDIDEEICNEEQN